MGTEIYYLTEKDVELINIAVIETLSPQEQAGVKDRNLLRSAIDRPKQSVFGEDAYPTIYNKAAALFESLAQNHPFHNGNKRVAFTALDHFLFYNGYDLQLNEEEAYQFTMAVVLKEIELTKITGFLREHTKKLTE